MMDSTYFISLRVITDGGLAGTQVPVSLLRYPVWCSFEYILLFQVVMEYWMERRPITRKLTRTIWLRLMAPLLTNGAAGLAHPSLAFRLMVEGASLFQGAPPCA